MRGGGARRALTGLLAAACAIALAGCSLLPGLGAQAQPEQSSGSLPLPAKPAGTVEGFGSQQPKWQSCGKALECADVYAPLDWAQPEGERITLRLNKHRATGSDRLGTLFMNPGGPGASGVGQVTGNLQGSTSAALRSQYDIVSWDPRGVSASSPVRCLTDRETDERLYGLDPEADLPEGSDEWIAAANAEVRKYGEACQKRTGALLGHVDTGSTVQDLDMLRAIVGDPKLNYLGYSYGTYIGARYADRYPAKVGRLVLDGAMDPTASLSEVVYAQTLGFESALRAYVADCIGTSGCPFTGSVDAGMRQIGRVLQQVDQKPLKGADGRWVTVGTLITAIITPLYSQDSWPYLTDLFTQVPKGDATVALQLADFYNDRVDGKYQSNSSDAFSAINCLDYPRDQDAATMRREAAELAAAAPTMGKYQGYSGVSCGGWPIEPVGDRSAVRAAGAAPIMVVGTTGDPATPYRWAQSLAKQLESGTLVTFTGEGHTAYGTGNACVTRTVDDYLLRGRVPSADPQCS